MHTCTDTHVAYRRLGMTNVSEQKGTNAVCRNDNNKKKATGKYREQMWKYTQTHTHTYSGGMVNTPAALAEWIYYGIDRA